MVELKNCYISSMLEIIKKLKISVCFVQILCKWKTATL